MSDKAFYFMISGKVQGVCYRAWMCEEARKLNVKGWVRNLTDGRVEALCIGDESNLNKLKKLCHSGPSAANVDKVTTRPAQDVQQDYTGFSQKPTCAPEGPS